MWSPGSADTKSAKERQVFTCGRFLWSRRKWNLPISFFCDSFSYTATSSPTLRADQIPATPLRWKRFSLINKSSSRRASSNNLRASVPYFSELNIFGKVPFKLQVTKKGVQSIISATDAASIRSNRVTPGFFGAGCRGALGSRPFCRASAKGITSVGWFFSYASRLLNWLSLRDSMKAFFFCGLSKSLQTLVTKDASLTWTTGPS